MADYDLGTARGTVEIDFKGEGLDRANKKLGDTKDKAESVNQAAGVVGKGMAGAGAAIAAGFAVAVKSAVTFEKRMSAVKAVSGASGEEMKQLTDLALKLGAETKYNAEEAGAAIEELVKAGVKIPDVMNGAAKATVNLAAAGEIDLPQAAMIASNAMNQFGLEGSKMPRIADLIAGAANASAIDVKDFGYSLSQAGAVANLTGMSFDDLSVAIAEMGNAGIKGSDAGTSIKTFLSNLIPDTDKARKMFVELGLVSVDTGENLKKLAAQGIKPVSNSYADVVDALEKYVVKQGLAKEGSAKAMKLAQEYGGEMGVLRNQFFDSEGSLKSFAEVQELLAKSTASLTKEQKLSTLQTLFGSDAIRAAAVFADSGSKGFNDMAAAMGKVTAESTAQERMNNLAGQWELLTGALETLAIDVGRILLPFLKDLVTAVLKIVDVWEKLSPQTKTIVTVIGAVVAIFLLLTGVILALVAPMAAMAGMMATAGVALLPLIGIVAAVVAGLMLLVAAVILVIKNWDKIKAATIRVWGAIKSFFVGVWDAIRDAFQAGIDWVKDVAATLWQGVAGFFTAAWGGIAGFFVGLWENIAGFFVGVWQRIVAAVMTQVNAVRSIIQAVTGVILTVWRAFWNTFGGLITAVWELIKAVVGLGIKALLFVMQATLWAIQQVWEKVWGGISSFFIAVWETVAGFVGPKVAAIRDKVVSVVTAIYDKVVSILTKVRDFWIKVWGAVSTYVSTTWSKVYTAVTGVLLKMYTFIATKIAAIRDKLKSVWDSVYGTLKSAWDRMVSYAATKITALLAKITGLKDKVVNAMRNAGAWLKDAGRRIIQGLIDGVTRKINDLTALLKNLTDMIPSWKGPASRDEKLLYENGELIMDGLIRAVGDKIPAFASLLRGFTNDIPGMLTPGAGGAALQAPTTDARSYGSSVHQDVKIYYPVAERSSKAVKKSLDFAGAFGEV